MFCVLLIQIYTLGIWWSIFLFRLLPFLRLLILVVIEYVLSIRFKNNNAISFLHCSITGILTDSSSVCLNPLPSYHSISFLVVQFDVVQRVFYYVLGDQMSLLPVIKSVPVKSRNRDANLHCTGTWFLFIHLKDISLLSFLY